jgi:hypothetical protein
MIDLDEVAGVPSDAALDRVATTVRQQQEIERRVEELAQSLDDAKRLLRRISEVDLPEAMRDAGGITRVDLEGGLRVEVKPYYEASISQAHAAEAFAWLRNNGHADLIKREVRVLFGRGEDEAAAATIDSLRATGLEPDEKIAVHPQTLRAFVREQLEAGQNLPHDLLGIYAGQRAKITPPK